jgi:hypothetical protein
MKKTDLSFIIDSLMFLVLMAMAGLGFLMKYTLPPGREVWVKYGRNADLTWLGWDRHDWGSIHLNLAFIMLGLLALHLFLHRNQIPALFARLVPEPKKRFKVAMIFLILGLLLIYFPFLITPEVGERGGGGGGRHRSEMGAAARPAPMVAAAANGFARPDLICQEAPPGAPQQLA